MQYNFSINCETISDVTNQIKHEIRLIFKNLNQAWQDICDGADCTNLVFSVANCNATMVDLEFSLSFFR